MDTTSAILMVLLQMAAATATAQPLFIPLTELITLAFGKLATEQERDELQLAIGAVATGTQSLEAGVTAATERILEIEQRDIEGNLPARFERFHTYCAEAIALHTLLHAPIIRSTEAQITHFQAIRSFNVAAGSTAPAIIVAGAMPPHAAKQRVPLAKHSLLERIEVFYDQRSPYPYLTLHVASMSETLDWTTMRAQFHFTDTAGDGLQLLHRNDRKLGRIKLERLRPPLQVGEPPFVLLLAPSADAPMTALTILDVNDRPIARCLRIVPAVYSP